MSNFPKMNRRDFIKTATMGFFAAGTLGFLPYEKVFAADSLSVKTRYGTFNGFQGKNGVSTWLE
jgi:para-nitrobenzyl esterase